MPTILTSICCVYKEKIPKKVVSIKIQKDATYDLDRKKIYLISNKSFRYYTYGHRLSFATFAFS